MKKFIFIALIVLTAGVIYLTNSHVTISNAQEKSVKALDYALWANVLASFVDDQGRVDYERLLKNRSGFDQFINQVETIDVTTMSQLEEKAFWINAYNAITMKVILEHYPVKSIRHINFGFVWEKGRDVAGQKKSLGDIEHKILRPQGDPRIHFAINCASIGCPNLPKKPFYPETLDMQLDLEAKKFNNNKEKVRLDRSKNILFYSAIYDWFEEDFLEVEPDLRNYIMRYINDDDQKYLKNNKVKLKKLKYDWNLNKQ